MSDNDQQREVGDGLSGEVSQLSSLGRYLALLTAFLGWLFAGTQMSITTLAMGSAAIDLLGTDDENIVGMWFGFYVCAFLLGAATGGFVFGWVGDRFGRTRAMALSILTYSILSGVTYYVQSPEQLLVLRFLTCMGIGGMWPNGVALASEAWPDLSRPMVAGIIGTAANVGIVSMAGLATVVKIDSGDWRWVMILGAAPALLGLFVLAFVPESPRWLAARGRASGTFRRAVNPTPVSEVFRPPLLRVTVIGIVLGTVPLMGGWGSANWVMRWAGQVGEESVPRDPYLKARLQVSRSLASTVGSLLGGLIAIALGRRRTYFLISLASLAISQVQFWFMHPADTEFLILFGVWGFCNGVYFGWLPLCLPELFPTRVRATGAGVSFNWGRLLTAVAVLLTGALLGVFGGYAELGRLTSLIFAVGMVVVWFFPGTTGSRLED